MAYELHIERESPIGLDEWQSAVQQSTVARLVEVAVSSTNPGVS
jgi:hypothetical protein